MNSYNECRYECIENDLLGSINLGTIHSIAPYRSKGIERASELQVCWSNKANNTGKSTIHSIAPYIDCSTSVVIAVTQHIFYDHVGFLIYKLICLR